MTNGTNKEGQMPPGFITSNVGNKVLSEHNIPQDQGRKKRQDLFNDDIPQIKNNSINDLDDFNIPQDSKLKQNDLTTIFDNEPVNTNIGQDFDNTYNLLALGQTTPNVGNEELKIIYDNEPKNKNIGNDIDIVFENPIHNREVKLDIFKQSEPGILTPNIDNKKLNDVVFNNEPKNKNIGGDIDVIFENPKKQNIEMNLEKVYDNPIFDRKTELDTITNKMINRKNIGTDLGKLY